MDSHAECVLAIEGNKFPPHVACTGFHLLSAGDALDLLRAAGLWIGPRAVLEGNEAFRQVISYTVLRVGDGFVTYRRAVSGREPRLHGRVSVGIGGHVDFHDVVRVDNMIGLERSLRAAADREVQEELGLHLPCSKDKLGLLVDNDTAVGRVHVGVVELWTLETAPRSAEEHAISDVRISTVADLQAISGQLERWSLLVLPHLARCILASR
jgi:predicted NUDIX family phosphoesterase